MLVTRVTHRFLPRHTPPTHIHTHTRSARTGGGAGGVRAGCKVLVRVVSGCSVPCTPVRPQGLVCSGTCAHTAWAARVVVACVYPKRDPCTAVTSTILPLVVCGAPTFLLSPCARLVQLQREHSLVQPSVFPNEEKEAKDLWHNPAVKSASAIMAVLAGRPPPRALGTSWCRCVCGGCARPVGDRVGLVLPSLAALIVWLCLKPFARLQCR
jgi:hypothetical protein